jgi:hypothetical protein
VQEGKKGGRDKRPLKPWRISGLYNAKARDSQIRKLNDKTQLFYRRRSQTYFYNFS